MRGVFFFLVMAMWSSMVAEGYMNIVLVGPRKETYPLAKHYAEFYNLPFLQEVVHLYPKRFIMISEETRQLESTLTIDIGDYPYKQKNANYFISWVKQKFSST